VYLSLNKLNLLEDCLIKNGIEVIHVRNLHHITSVYRFEHSSYLYTEVYLAVDATSYFLDKNKKVTSKIIESLFLTIDTSEVINIDDNNVGALLLDQDRLIRAASKDWLTAS